MRILFTLLALAAPLAAAVPEIAWPLERRAYFCGEIVPLGITGGAQVEVVDSANRVAASGKAGALRLDTSRLAPGEYAVRVDGNTAGHFSLTNTLRRSPGILSDSVYDLPVKARQQAASAVAGAKRKQLARQEALTKAEAQLAKAKEDRRANAQAAVDQARAELEKSEKELADAEAQAAELREGRELKRQLRESGIGAFTLVGTDQGPLFERFWDELAPLQIMNYVNPYGRASSFFGANVHEPEVNGMAERMLHIAQSNLRFPNFGGFIYHWDPLGFNREPRSYYWIIERHVKPRFLQAVQAYEDAKRKQFHNRTGLQPPEKLDYLHYAAAIHQPDLGPAFDLPTKKWIEAIIANSPAMPPEETRQLERKIDAWTRYLMDIMPEASATFQQRLRELEPSLKNTASHDNQFLPREGSWPPSAYEPLDFRWVEAWSDQHDGAATDYVYQWLFHAALADANNPNGEPVWVASILNGAHANFEFPGRFARAAAQILAYDGRGMGLAKEGFTNLFGGLYAGTHWDRIADKPSRFDWELGRDFLWRFAPLQEQSEPVRRVAVLLSEGQFALQQPGLGLGGSPQFEVFVHLARLGYTPRYLTERLIEAGALAGFDSLVILNHFAPLPERTRRKLEEFTAAGGRILLSKNSSIQINGAQALDLSLPFRWPGRVYNIPAANYVGRERSPQLLEKFLRRDGPTLRAALGNKTRTLLIPEGDEQSLISTFALGGGPDAAYVVATNDTIHAKSGSWARQDGRLLPNPEAGADQFAALYELTEEKSLGAVAPALAKFQDTTVRVFGLLKRPVKSVELLATQSVKAGEKLVISVAFLDEQRQRLNAAIPFHLEITDPAGQWAAAYDRSTAADGRFAMEIPLGVNAVPGAWKLSARSCLDGTTVSLPIEVQAGQPARLEPVKEPVIARNGAAIEKLWAGRPTVVAPIWDGPQKAARLAAARAAKEALAPLGVEVDVREHPAILPCVLAWKLTPEQTQHNQPVERGEAIGRRTLDTGRNVDHYYSSITNYYFPQPLLLIQIPGEQADPLAQTLARQGILWPAVSDAFPGGGKAVVQAVASAFKLGVDSVVVQATDASGLIAGAQALARPPADWISPGVARARVELQRGMSMDRTAAEAAGLPLFDRPGMDRLTSRNANIGSEPAALRLPAATVSGTGQLPPSREEAYAISPEPPPRALAIPGTFAIKDGTFFPYYRPQGEWVPASEKKTNGDLRFSEGSQGRISVIRPGRYRITAKGKFRFSDHRPATQPSWVDYLDEYMATVKPKREPMAFAVLLDGKPIGRLGEFTPVQAEAEISFALGRGLKAPEELVTEVSGVVELPAGEHELLLVHEHIVDGKLAEVSIQPENEP